MLRKHILPNWDASVGPLGILSVSIGTTEQNNLHNWGASVGTLDIPSVSFGTPEPNFVAA
jgi:hypothetical protein